MTPKMMEYLSNIYYYFTNDPIRILALVGGSGGLVYWYDRYKNRSRLKIRLIEFGLFPKTGNQKACIKFEAENIGKIPISLEPVILLSGIIPVELRKEPYPKLERITYQYVIDSSDRHLPPHDPKVFEASGDIDELLPYLWFMIYTFTPTRGKAHKIRVRSASKFLLTYVQYIYEVMSYAAFSKLNIE